MNVRKKKKLMWSEILVSMEVNVDNFFVQDTVNITREVKVTQAYS